MRCQLCKKDSRISYSTRLYGEICNVCMCAIKNSDEEKKLKELDIIKMHKKYSVRI